MSVANSSSRDPKTNAGSDTAGQYRKGSPMEQFHRSSAGGAKPTQNDPHILSTPKVPTSNGIIKDKV